MVVANDLTEPTICGFRGASILQVRVHVVLCGGASERADSCCGAIVLAEPFPLRVRVRLERRCTEAAGGLRWPAGDGVPNTAESRHRQLCTLTVCNLSDSRRSPLCALLAVRIARANVTDLPAAASRFRRG